MAEAAGYRQTMSIGSLEEWDRRLPELMQIQGPVFVDVPMERGATYPEDFERLYSPAYRDAFRTALQASR